jgi:hypothetical protein
MTVLRVHNLYRITLNQRVGAHRPPLMSAIYRSIPMIGVVAFCWPGST